MCGKLLTATQGRARRPLHTTPMGSLSGRPQDNLLSQSLKLVSSSIAAKKAQPGWLAAPPVPTSPVQALTSCPSENATLLQKITSSQTTNIKRHPNTQTTQTLLHYHWAGLAAPTSREHDEGLSHQERGLFPRRAELLFWEVCLLTQQEICQRHGEGKVWELGQVPMSLRGENQRQSSQAGSTMCDDNLTSGGFPFAEATDTVVPLILSPALSLLHTSTCAQVPLINQAEWLIAAKQNGSLKYDSKNNVTFFFHHFTRS